jgi:hypothetical protein
MGSVIKIASEPKSDATQGRDLALQSGAWAFELVGKLPDVHERIGERFAVRILTPKAASPVPSPEVVEVRDRPGPLACHCLFEEIRDVALVDHDAVYGDKSRNRLAVDHRDQVF